MRRYIFAEDKRKNYWVIFGKCVGWVALGTVVGILFFYVFKDLSVILIEKFKFLQSVFGISQYQQGMLFGRVLSTILIGNLVSTIAYFILGYLKALIPISIITGFFVVVFLMTGIIRNQQAIPLEVILLMSGETAYRIIAITTGEHLQKNKLKKRWVFITSVIVIVVLFIAMAFYEVYQIFG